MRIIIVGKGGSGKDFLKDKFLSRGFTRSVSVTTRPRRSDEVYGVNYRFISVNLFEHLIGKGEFHEYDNFNGWYYGTSNKEWINNQIFIKTPNGVHKISKEDRKQCVVIYLDIDKNIRFERLSKRNDADDVTRRILADEKDFENFSDYDIRITNPDF